MTDSGSAHSVAIIGGGSGGEALVRALADTEESIILFEPELVGGECPFLACMPSKAMLHDRVTGRDWDTAVDRRDEIVSHLDDSGHADEAMDLGATLVRERAVITGPGRVEAGGVTYAVEHIVVATGAEPSMPEIDGLDPEHERVWTSADALTIDRRPQSVVVIGGGVIGSELAFMFSGFGIAATTIDSAPRPSPDMHPRVSELIAQTLTTAGVTLVNDAEIVRVDLPEDGAPMSHEVTVHLADGSHHSGEQLIVAIGREPRHRGLGLETLGVDPDDIEIDDAGRLVTGDGAPPHSVWFVGDAAGVQQYTHVANHHAEVVADHIAGAGTRHYDEVVVPACMFTDPPVIVVGPSWSEFDVDGDADLVVAEIELDVPRANTDEHGDGFLAVAARRSTGCVVAANGIGARFDEIVHALVIAIDGCVPVSRLAMSIQPFPTVGEILGQAFGSLAGQLDP